MKGNSDRQRVTEAEYVQEMMPPFDQVFAGYNPFDEPFRAQIESRALLFPVPYGLDEQGFQALSQAADKLGENAFYVRYLEIERDADGSPFAWRSTFDDWDAYRRLTTSLENALFSVNGTWGVIFSHQLHALVGGPASFTDTLLDKLLATVPDDGSAPIPPREQVRDFIEDCRLLQERFEADVSWLPGLLAHVYGPEQARSLLKKADLGHLLK